MVGVMSMEKSGNCLMVRHSKTYRFTRFTFTNRRIYLLVLENTKIYINIHTKMHFSINFNINFNAF